MTQPDIVSKVKGSVGGLLNFGGGGTAAPAAGPSGKVGTLKTALDTLKAQMPDPDSYAGDAAAFQDDLAVWLELMNSATAAYQDQQTSAWGYITLPDGTMLPTGDLTPEQRAVFDTANEAKYNNVLNQLGLTQANLVADRRQADFNNSLSRINSAMNVDDTRLKKAEGQINRQLSGMGESRSRADLIANTKLQAAPYATQGGKTSFSGNDLGSLLGEFSAFAGVDPNSSLLNYQGTSMVDPEADMQRFDSLLGVDGALPGLPSLLTEGAGYEIPGAPDLGGIPQLSASRAVLPQAAAAPAASTGTSAANAVGGAVQALLAKLFGGGSGGAAQGGAAPSFSNPGTFNPAAGGQSNQSLLDAAAGGYKARLLGGK